MRIFWVSLFFLTLISVLANYYVFVVKTEFEVLQNEDGPDLTDYF